MNRHFPPPHAEARAAVSSDDARPRHPRRDDLLGDYFRAADTWESEIHRALRASRLRAWVAAGIATTIAVLSLAAVVLVLPLKEYAPYVIEVDRTTGHLEVMRALTPGAQAPDEAITEANLVRWIVARETYDPADIRTRFDEVRRTTRGDALADYRRLWTPDAPTNPVVRWGHGTRITTTVKAVSLLKPDTAAVRYVLTRIDDVTGATFTSHWVAIVSFRYADTPMRVRDRWTNPLGFEVTGFRADQESIGEAARAPAAQLSSPEGAARP
ncbi:MAG: type IV secretion system protein VirB8 [Alphaproteobacteria bacterium]|nr:MAG: type IV secretion system protein VirB8 [Caulobacteraceae bacterium]TPW01528.1 MAG: type IV secretion system protein VirB8 [Alphaproteobacteria bacterium]